MKTKIALILGLVSAAAGLTFSQPKVATTPPAHPTTRTDAKTTTATPKGLSPADWKSICAIHQTQRHAVTSAAAGNYRALNPEQEWLTEWDGRGFTTQPQKGEWKWGLELRSYGFAGHEHAVGKGDRSKAEGERVIFKRGEGLQEWFVNDQRGLEQGFTLTQRPAGAGALEFHFETRGNLHPKISSDGSGVSFVAEDGTNVVNYGGLEVWDADGKKIAARFVAAAGEGFLLRVEDNGARYPITIDPIAQQAYLKASNTDVGDNFGFAVAISGDTIVVGAFGESSAATGVNGNQSNNNASFSGAAYVFVRTGSTWAQQAYLKASNTDANDEFGAAVSISGDTIAVGAPFESSAATGVNGNQNDNSAQFAGAAYVFVRTGTTWTQQAYLKASNTDANDGFGTAVSISGDSIAVGADGESSIASGVNGNQSDNSATNSGAAYIFVRNGTTWVQQAYLKASNPDAGDLFGEFAAISGDTVIVGAEEESSNGKGVNNGNQNDNSASEAGAAYIFVRNGTTWTQQAYLKASNTDAGDHFGISVAISGDTALVGASHESSKATGINGDQSDNSASLAGAAYVFVRNGTTWTQQAYLKASNTDPGDHFGIGVAISGDTAVVGALFEGSNATGVNGNQNDNSASEAGAAYVFVRNGTTWTQQAYLKASNTDAGDLFGWKGIAVSGDTAVIGASQESSNATGVNGNQSDNSASLAGAAYVSAGLPSGFYTPPGGGGGGGGNVMINEGIAQVTFSQVTIAGRTSFKPLSTSSAPVPPPGYSIVSTGPAYDITTTAVYTSPVGVCFTVSSVNDPTAFSKLRILHEENGVLVDRTSSLDFTQRMVCAQVSSLSPFYLATATSTPPSPKSIRGKGTIAANGGQALFNFDVDVDASGGITEGRLTYNDWRTGFTFKSTHVAAEAVGPQGKHAHFSGTGTITGNGAGNVHFTVGVADLSTNGAEDQFTIHLSNGYSASGTLKSGNIEIGK